VRPGSADADATRTRIGQHSGGKHPHQEVTVVIARLRGKGRGRTGQQRQGTDKKSDLLHRKPRFRPNTARTSLASQRLTTSEFTFFANRAVAERLLHPPADAGQAAVHPRARVATATRKLLMQIKH
jgi:hypothetical protein